MSTEEHRDYASKRRDAYKILSACYYAPEQGVLDQLPELQAALAVICPDAVDHVAAMRREIDLEALSVDFSRLFVGPFRLLAAPYGSIYLEDKREIMGPTTLDARRRYLEAGLVFSDDVKDAPDHIAFELEFMYYLVFKEIEALEGGDLSAALDFLGQQKAFLIDHLGAWAPRFASEVELNARTAFYQDLAKATDVFIRQDIYYVMVMMQVDGEQ